MENENDRSFERDPNYADLYSYFEKIFRSHYLSINDYFDGNVWFLSDDSEFYKNKLNTQTTPNTTINPENYNLMHQILEENSVNKNDFKKLKVNVGIFINALIIELLKIQKQRIKIGQKIQSFNIDENVNIIEEKVDRLKEEAYGSKTESYLKINLVRSENLPEGEYEFSLFMKTLKKNKLVDKGIVDNKVEVIPLGQRIEIKDKIFDFKDCFFQRLKIFPIDINYNEFKPDEDILKIYSGTNLNSLQIECKNTKTNSVFKSKTEEIIELYLKLIDFFCDLTRVNNDCVLTLNLYEENSRKSSKSEVKLSINLNFLIENSVRKYILERIHYIFKLSVSYRSMVDNNLHTLMKYFIKYSENIKILLERETVEQRPGCCGGKCILF